MERTCPECGHPTDVFRTGGGEAAAAELGLSFLGRISLDAGKPFVLSQPDSEASQAFAEIVQQVRKIVEEDGSEA